ncbi:MAG: zinc ribbon domain-containing protein [Candidatus Poribacteria bacterium]
MPIYEYQCKECNSKFEVLQSINATNEGLICPKCGASEPKKVFSLFASFGSGKTAECKTGST